MNLSLWCLVLGYGLVIAASTILYRNAPLYIGRGQLPVLKEGEAERYFPAQEADLRSRQVWSRRGFVLLLAGSILQLLGVMVAAASTGRS